MQRGEKLAEKIDEKRKNNERQTKGKALKQYKRNARENRIGKQAKAIPVNSVSVPVRKSKHVSKQVREQASRKQASKKQASNTEILDKMVKKIKKQPETDRLSREQRERMNINESQKHSSDGERRRISCS